MRIHFFIALCMVGSGLPLAGNGVAQQPAMQIDGDVDLSVPIPPAQTHHFGREIA